MMSSGNFSELVSMIVNKCWEDSTVDFSAFTHDVKICIAINSADFASFVAGDLISSARCFVLESMTTVSPKAEFDSDDLDNLAAFAVHSKAFFEKIKQIAAMIANYDEWAAYV